jgi:FAD:protein FMN transferase
MAISGLIGLSLLSGRMAIVQISSPALPQVFTQVHMGVSVRLTLFSTNEESARVAAERAFARFREIDSRMSDYQQASELSQINRSLGKPMTVSDEMIRILAQARQISVETDGIFDVTVGPLIALWRKSRQSGKIHLPVEFENAKLNTGMKFLRISPQRNEIAIFKPGVRIDLGGIAKGYACHQAILETQRAGIRSAMIEAGGDLFCSEPPPGKSGWKIQIQGTRKFLEVKSAAVSTSGSTEQFVTIDGRRYSHLVDPRTGLGIQNLRQATVIGKNGARVDALATALCIEPSLQTRLREEKVIFAERAD